MKFQLYRVDGYAEAIMSLQMSRGKYAWDKAQAINDLVYVCTNKYGFIETPEMYEAKLYRMGLEHKKVTGDYEKDVAEFERLLTLVMDNAMRLHDHHTLMKYIDFSFFTDGLHRGAQDDLDAHAIAFNNRITRFSTRLATIDDVTMSDWYKDKVIPFSEALKLAYKENQELFLDECGQDPFDSRPEDYIEGTNMPRELYVDGKTFKFTPFGYVLDKYADQNHDSASRHDVVRGLIPLGTPGPALWKIDLPNFRYIYYRRGQLTKANPELKEGIEQLADQIEENIPVFGKHIRQVYTDTKQWELVHKVKTVTLDEWKEFQKWKNSKQDNE